MAVLLNLKEALEEARRLEPKLRDLPWIEAEEAGELLAWLIEYHTDHSRPLYEDHGGE